MPCDGQHRAEDQARREDHHRAGSPELQFLARFPERVDIADRPRSVHRQRGREQLEAQYTIEMPHTPASSFFHQVLKSAPKIAKFGTTPLNGLLDAASTVLAWIGKLLDEQ